ncbi:MAG: histidine kinase [Saprospiraceae bacterium]|nr:MAG: histidine kinase [Saprospiraceae bacterium]
MFIRKGQARIYQWLRKDLIQHLGFGVFVFVLVFCFFAIHAWYQGRIELLETLDYKREAFWIVFREAAIYTLAMAIPVYFNLALIYKGRIQEFLETRIFTKADLRGWGFYIFLGFSMITAIVFALMYAPMFNHLLLLIKQEWYQTVLAILIFILCTTGISYTKEAIERHRELERMERREAIRKRREAEKQLQFIKKQIRPHFLFNTLANLKILAQTKSEALPGLIGELSRLLRYLVYHTDERLVPLEEELNFLASYLELQELQLSKGTNLQFTRRGEVKAHHRIAPMILLQFIENCFKHYNHKGNEPKFIHIELDISADYLDVLIENSYKPNARNEDNFTEKHRNGGVGLASAIENIHLVYSDSCTLVIEAKNNVHTVHLKIPLL